MSTVTCSRLPFALLAQLFDFALDHVALQHAKMLQKENSVEVVDFVAKRAGQKVLAANFERLAFDVLCFDSDKLGAHDVAAKAGNGEAAFFFADFAFGVSN